ncbi:hypothetical protein IC607_02490 [Cellulomonas sp. JH27-2]|uniref:hypothetical protein n=1 Tax=Cellulomonas sp. JH27-2 TaxID=2774139 RepID=UPI00177B7386|nr:hypothetical protein [Cellulomonas sp. JH27-2]MBD8057834.1 hypothetical protein [Cellulomonas sp. JH27-2]
MIDPLDAFRRVWFVDEAEPAPHALDATVWHRQNEGELWAVGLVLNHPSMPWLLSEDPVGMYGSAIGGLGDMLLRQDVRLPAWLVRWSTARGVPAAQIGPGRSVFVELDGLPLLAQRWTIDDLDATVMTAGWEEIVAFTPTGRDVRLVTTYHR